MVSLPNAITKYRNDAIRPAPPRPTTYPTWLARNASPALAATSTPNVIDHCEPMADPDRVHQKVARPDVVRGRQRE